MQAVLQYKEYKGLQKCANTGLKVTGWPQAKKEDFTNEDGQIYILPDGADVDYMNPGVISPQIRTFAQDRQQAMRDLAGNNEVSEGKSPHPNASGVTVEKLQLMAIGRQRFKIRQNMYYSIPRMNRISCGNVMQFWTTGKVIGIDSKDGFDSQIIYNPLEMADIDFNIEIDEGSMAGVDKEAFNGMLYGMLVNQLISLPTFLQVADIPKKNELIKLTDNAAQKQAIMDQLQQQNVMLKYEHAPETLTPDEIKIAEQLVTQSGVATDQPA